MNITPKTLVLSLVFLLIVGCTVFVLQSYLPGIGLSDSGELRPATRKTKYFFADKADKMSAVVDIRQVNLLTEDLPANLDLVAKNVKVVDNHLRVMNRDMFYREALPPENLAPSQQDALLLHGMNFKSLTWLELNTINLLAGMGHRVVALDLPGYGETGGDQLDDSVKGDFLNAAIEALDLKKPIVVSPSMSGSYSLPYLFKFPGKMGGYAPVAPIFTEKYTAEEYHSIKTPTVIIYGEADEQLGELSTTNLKNLPNSQVRMLEKARHPAYLDQPAVFHKLLYNFFLRLKD